MSISDDADPAALIARLAGPLAPPDREAFRRAAEDALTRVPCWGEGAVYRAVAALQRAYFHPPDDRMTGNLRLRRPTKLTSAPAIAADDVRVVASRRRRFGAV
jgi:uncharacterized protein (DUF2342 family)